MSDDAGGGKSKNTGKGKKTAAQLRAGLGDLILRYREQRYWQRHYLAAVCLSVPLGEKLTVTSLAKEVIGEKIWRKVIKECDAYTKAIGQAPVMAFDLYMAIQSAPRVVRIDFTSRETIVSSSASILELTAEFSDAIILPVDSDFQTPTPEWIDALPFAPMVHDAIAETDRRLRLWNLDGYETASGDTHADVPWMRCAVMATASDHIHLHTAHYRPNQYSLGFDPDTYPEFGPYDLVANLEVGAGFSFTVDGFLPDEETARSWERRMRRKFESELSNYLDSQKELARTIPGLVPTKAMKEKCAYAHFELLASYQVGGITTYELRERSGTSKDAARIVNELAGLIGLPLRKPSPKGRHLGT